jgi:NhaA family Na+:H+ antiporter
VARTANHVLALLQEFSIPLLSGVALALLAANLAPDAYHDILHAKPFGDIVVFGHELTFHFLVNDIFMVFFFAIAAKEITEACLPGGSLNPLSKAVNPLFATAGGVLGPVIVFFVGLTLCFELDIYSVAADDPAQLARGWGIPTATDIALAWLVARAVFGKRHPAVVFLLLLAVADDAIGLVIIAVFYGDPTQPAAPAYLLVSLVGMGVAFELRRRGVRQWLAYVALAGPFAWSGLVLAHLHPALALTTVIPFMPGPSRDTGLFEGADEVDLLGDATVHALHIEHSPLHLFEQQVKIFVDYGLFFFAFANAGVAFAVVGPMTWIVLAALVVGKTCGVGLCGLLATRLGFALPQGMSHLDLAVAGFIAAIGLTVALFVAGAAYLDPVLQGQAKMGALLSGGLGLVAIAVGRMLGLRQDQ